MPHRTYSLHKITNGMDTGFDPANYSRFKFGDTSVARHFGTALADSFIKDVLSPAGISRQIVVLSSPYSFIPTATFAMKNYFVFQLNRWLAAHGLPVAQDAKVYRTITYKDDYGELDAAQRMALIGNDSFHIDNAFLEGKALIFLDDIKITGSHEKMILKMVQEYGLTNDIFMLYFAELANPEIHPNIENYLNYYEVKSIFDLDSIIDSGNFSMNTRFVKYILNYDHEGCKVFLQNKSDVFLSELYDQALGNNYHTMDNYSVNLNYIKQRIFTNNKKLIQYVN